MRPVMPLSAMMNECVMPRQYVVLFDAYAAAGSDAIGSSNVASLLADTGGWPDAG